MPRRPGRPQPALPWRGAALWLLAVGLACLVLWLWWHGGRSLEEVVAPPAPAPVTNRVAAPVLPPPVVVVTSPPPAALVVTAAPPAVPAMTNPPAPPPGFERLVALQVGLSRRGISVGPLDGVLGSQTRAAVRAFQEMEGLPPTGALDAETVRRLAPAGPVYTEFRVTTADMAGLGRVPDTWLGKSQAAALGHENILELVAERSHAHPNLVVRLNPRLDWAYVGAGSVLRVPDAAYPAPHAKAAFLRIRLAEKTLRAYDGAANLLFHAPCSIARRVEKRPVGRLAVTKLAAGPNYLFDPAVFTESAEARRLGRKLMIPPGPNNPVGTAWISLDRPGYGIHGTPHPEQVGRTESHGCFRLANWNAEHLLRLVWIGLPVHVEP
jgi:lipoprotein-anchoring transpeptidase ErfK/SrfK